MTHLLNRIMNAFHPRTYSATFILDGRRFTVTIEAPDAVTAAEEAGRMADDEAIVLDVQEVTA